MKGREDRSGDRLAEEQDGTVWLPNEIKEQDKTGR